MVIPQLLRRFDDESLNNIGIAYHHTLSGKGRLIDGTMEIKDALAELGFSSAPQAHRQSQSSNRTRPSSRSKAGSNDHCSVWWCLGSRYKCRVSTNEKWLCWCRGGGVAQSYRWDDAVHLLLLSRHITRWNEPLNQTQRCWLMMILGKTKNKKIY